jgi:hypothetical protein
MAMAIASATAPAPAAERTAGLADPEDAFVRYAARLSQQDHSAGTEFGVFVLPPGVDDAHVMRGSTLASPPADCASGPPRSDRTRRGDHG